MVKVDNQAVFNFFLFKVDPSSVVCLESFIDFTHMSGRIYVF